MTTIIKLYQVAVQPPVTGSGVNAAYLQFSLCTSWGGGGPDGKFVLSVILSKFYDK